MSTRAGVGPETVGLLVSLSVGGRLVALWLGGRLSDRWGRMRVLAPGLLVYAVLLVSMSLLTDPTLLGLLSFAIGAMLLLSAISSAQDTGYISGTVSDKSGAAVVGAEVVVALESGSLTRATDWC